MKKQSGFTLIEVLIVVAIIGIIAAIAVPSYREQVRSANRADAQGALSGLAQAMERHFTNNGSYTGAAALGANTGSPDIFPTQAPLDSSGKTYNLVIVAPTNDAVYTIQAQPINGTNMAGDGIFQLNSAGRRAWDRDDDGIGANDMCWQKTC